MASSFDRVLVHTVFSTKYRLPWIDQVVEPQLHLIISSVLVRKGCQVLEINGSVDHVHILHTVPRTQPIANLVRDAKSQSSAWIKNFDERIYGEFAWQDGYSVFSVDYRNTEGLVTYIRQQKQHHGKDNERMTFREEFEIILKKYNVTDYNPAFVFPDPPSK